MAGINVKAAGTWRTAYPFVKDGGVWKPAVSGFVKDAGSWKQFFGLTTISFTAAQQAILNTNAGAKAVTFTPAVGDVLVAIASFTGATAGTPGMVTDNQGGTWTAYAEGSVASTQRSVCAWLRTAKVASAVAHTVTVTPAAGDTGGGLSVYRLAGCSDAFGMRMTATVNDAATGTPLTIPLSLAARGQNALIAAIGCGIINTPTPPAGWTLGHSANYSVPAFVIYTAYINSDETAATSISFGGTTTGTWCAALIEIGGWP